VYKDLEKGNNNQTFNLYKLNDIEYSDFKKLVEDASNNQS